MAPHSCSSSAGGASFCALALLCAFLLAPAVAGGQSINVKELPLASAAKTLPAAATPAAVAQERALRRAIANAAKSPVRFNLTTDIVLSAPFPDLKIDAKVSIIGRCKDRTGKPRSCVVDGAGKHTMFTGQLLCDIALERLVIQNVYGNVHVGGCSLSARYVVFRHNIGAKGVVLDARDSSPIQNGPDKFFHCSFINNTALTGNGGVFNVGKDLTGGPTMTFTGCTFRSNRAVRGMGGAVYSEGNVMVFRDTAFERNSAASGGAIATSAITFTAINTSFIANTARNGRGGAVVGKGQLGFGNYKFCYCMFSNNIAIPGHPTSVAILSRFAASKNIFFSTGNRRASVGFCPGPAPRGIQKPKLVSLVRNCTGCSGCDSDCNGNGKCVADPVYAFPSCRCNAFFDNYTSCSQCVQAHSIESKCRGCSPAYYHPKRNPATCTLCPGLPKSLEYKQLTLGINNVTSATGPLQCEKFCEAKGRPFTGTEKPPDYCNLWAYSPRRQGAPTACAGKCFMMSV